MPALDPETRERWRELVVVDRDAATVGTIGSFYLDRASGLPTWALVHAGWLGDRRAFIPLAEAVEADGEIRLPYTKAHVHQAPQVGTGSELTADQELALVGHYGLHDRHGAVAEPTPDPAAPVAPGAPTPAAPTPVAPTPGAPEPQRPFAGPPNREGSPAGHEVAAAVHSPRGTPPDTAPVPASEGVVVTRSEEELAVGVRTRRRRLRVRKYVVTDYVTRTFPVRREEVRLEELPGGELLDGGADGWEDPGEPGVPRLELVLHREEPEVRLRPVPVERVRLVASRVTEQRTITEPVRKERVEVDEGPRP